MAGSGTPTPNDASATTAPADKLDVPQTPNRNGEPLATENGSARVATNGSTPPSAAETKSPGPAAEPESNDEAPSKVEKAEELVDHLASRVAGWTSFLGRKIVQGSSRLREAAQDFWAEAQNIRRGKQE
jgi:hypothetical protein